MVRPCGGLLGVGGDLDGQLDTLLQGVPGPLVHGLHGLDVHAADHQVVLAETKTGPNQQLLIEAEHSRADNPVRVLYTKRTSESRSVLLLKPDTFRNQSIDQGLLIDCRGPGTC